MPKVRRRPKARRELDWTPGEREQLLTGRDWGGGFGRDELGEFDEPPAREAWSELHDELLPLWIYEHPRSRPWAWWRFDTREPRQRIDGKPHPFTNPDRDEASRALWFGAPCIFITLEELSHPPEYETEAAYLARLNLLTPTEIGVTTHD